MFLMDEESQASPDKTRKVRCVTVTAELRERWQKRNKTKESSTSLQIDVVQPIAPSHSSRLRHELVAEGMTPCFDVVCTLHELLFGDEAIQHLDWLGDTRLIHEAIHRKWPQANVAFIMFQLAQWLEEVHAFTIAERIMSFLYDHRSSLVT